MIKIPIYMSQTLDAFYNDNCKEHFEELFNRFYIPIYEAYQNRYFQLYLEPARYENNGKHFIQNISYLMIAMTKSLSEFNIDDFDNLKPVSGSLSHGNALFRSHVNKYMDSIMIDIIKERNDSICNIMSYDSVNRVSLESHDSIDSMHSCKSMYLDTLGDDIKLLNENYRELMYMCQSFYYDTQSRICTDKNVIAPFIGTHSFYCDLMIRLFTKLIGDDIEHGLCREYVDEWSKAQVREHRKLRRRMSVEVCNEVSYGKVAPPSLLKF